MQPWHYIRDSNKRVVCSLARIVNRGRIGLLNIGGKERQGAMETQARFCPECGSEESGFFCRSCGTLLSGEDQILCPRCHHIVPGAKFCNQCGQGLAGVALNLRQLSLAGDTFWVASGMPGGGATEPSPADVEPFPPMDAAALSPAELPDWLAEMSPPAAAPALPPPESRLYPKLGPIEKEPRPPSQRGFMVAVLVLMLVMFLGLAFIILFIMLRTGG